MFSRVPRSSPCLFLCGEKGGKVTQEWKKFLLFFATYLRTQPAVEVLAIVRQLTYLQLLELLARGFCFYDV